ncbi:hypothetical protein MRX96_048041 [Rhipicephalus microplus]
MLVPARGFPGNGDSNQVTGYDPESLQIIQMDTAQTETPLPTEEEYLKDMLRVCSRLCWAVSAAGQVGIPARIQAEDNGGEEGNKQGPTPKTGPKEAPATKSNKPEPKKTNTGHSTNVKSGTPSEPPVLVKDFPPLTPVQAQVSNPVLKAVQRWVIAQIKNTTQSDSPQVKRKPASRQAAEEGFSGPAPGPDRSSAP